MNNIYEFQFKKEAYYVEWEEEEGKVIKLTFTNNSSKILKVKRITLLGSIDQKQLDNIVKDYWKSYVKNELKTV